MININPLFEALQYFHRRAEGRLVRIELDRLCTRFPSKTNEFLRLLSPVADLQDRLDYLVRVGKRELSQLLTPVCSSPTPFACSNSIMYMMVFPAIRDGIDPENFTEYIYSKTDEDIMVDILSVLESPGTATVTEEITSDVFYERLENTGLDEQARLGVMKLLFKYKSYSERVSLLIDGFLNAMRRERENVASICSAFSKRYPEGSGVLKKVNDCYGMGLPDDIEMTSYCSIFMYDHIAAFVKQYQDDTGKDSGMVLMGIGYGSRHYLFPRGTRNAVQSPFRAEPFGHYQSASRKPRLRTGAFRKDRAAPHHHFPSYGTPCCGKPCGMRSAHRKNLLHAQQRIYNRYS